jgi:hypothetical protein
MSPGGHLVTTAVACAATHLLSGSWPLTAAVAAGGFFIDVDHAADYVLFERRRELTPGAFLRHYVEGRTQRLVLVLHSYELFTLLAVLAWWTQNGLIFGYLGGALMHLGFDLVFNGQHTPRSIFAFYSLAYRAVHRFDSPRLLGQSTFAPAGAFWKAFFRGSVVLDSVTPPPDASAETTTLRDSPPLANLPS